MRVRIRDFHPLDRPVFARGARIVAKFTAQLDHFRIYQVKLAECPERGLLIWAPSNIRLSMEGRAAILEKVKLKLEGP